MERAILTALCAALTLWVASTIDFLALGGGAPSPRPTITAAWIAHGCEGAGGDLWATDISDFPTRCKEIERWSAF
ncbi:MAG: hypothetical protein DI569_16885 [Sphingopyxis macrogoltabida]|uniref:Uncharacterized protein n=1 Tax=Sphingopyxis macrogoltabida TaxID=33050 RepID=A0A2W5KX28_SPHMC|nr:MAG: hypothetical protein DI569_16885 [Sphingopyxis macrogoltabida]